MFKAVCLVSGGLDSCVALAEAHAEGHSILCLHVSYGQLTATRELQAFQALADYYQAAGRLAINIPHLSMIGGSALTDPSIALPKGDLDRRGIPVSYVPFRNANLLSIATSWAEVEGAEYIYVGAVEEDSSGYPDCRQIFFQAFNRVIRTGIRPEGSIQIITPLIHLRKKDIVARGITLKAPLNLTWSCYREEDVACGQCDSCLLRLRGFKQAGVADPLPYRPG